jgi:signal peptidase II
LAAKPAAKVSVRALIVLTVVALVVFAIDQIAKTLVVANLTEGVRVEVLGQLLQFFLIKNPGAAFSIGSGSTWIFSIIATGVLVFVIWYARRIRSVGWAVLFGLLLGGLLGNLTDRLIREPGFGRGEVVDFLQIPLLPAIFNLADVAIVSSMVLFLILTVRGVSLDGTRYRAGGAAAGGPTDGEDAPSDDDAERDVTEVPDAPSQPGVR